MEAACFPYLEILPSRDFFAIKPIMMQGNRSSFFLAIFREQAICKRNMLSCVWQSNSQAFLFQLVRIRKIRSLINQTDEYNGENETCQDINVMVTNAAKHLNMECPVTQMLINFLLIAIDIAFKLLCQFSDYSM